MIEKIFPAFVLAVAIWYIVIGMMHCKKGENATHGLMYQLAGLLIAVMTTLAAWVKY